MDYDLKCEGFPVDHDLEERLLLTGRRLVVEVGPSHPVRLTVRQVDGRVQGRAELVLPGRRLTAVVWRSEPVAALSAAVSAVLAVLEEGADDPAPRAGAWALEEAVSTLQ